METKVLAAPGVIKTDSFGLKNADHQQPLRSRESGGISKAKHSMSWNRAEPWNSLLGCDSGGDDVEEAMEERGNVGVKRSTQASEELQVRFYFDCLVWQCSTCCTSRTVRSRALL